MQKFFKRKLKQYYPLLFSFEFILIEVVLVFLLFVGILVFRFFR